MINSPKQDPISLLNRKARLRREKSKSPEKKSLKHMRNSSMPEGIFKTSLDTGSEQKKDEKISRKKSMSIKEPTIENCNMSDYLPFIKSTKCLESNLNWMRKLRSPSHIKLPLYFIF